MQPRVAIYWLVTFFLSFKSFELMVQSICAHVNGPMDLSNSNKVKYWSPLSISTNMNKIKLFFTVKVMLILNLVERTIMTLKFYCS